MKKDKEQFKYLIYDLMMGSRNLEDYPVKESEVVTNEFEEGMYCDRPIMKYMMQTEGCVKD